jgi:hypothetical protein
MKLLTLITLLITLGSCKNNESILLRTKYTVGDEQTYTLTQSGGGNGKHYNSTTEFTVTLDSVLKSGGNKFFVKINSIKQDSDLDSSPVGAEQSVFSHYDSEKRYDEMTPGEKEMHLLLKDVFKTQYTIVIDNRGNITRPFGDWWGKPVEQPLDFTHVQLTFPEKRIKEGDSWTQEHKTAVGTVNNFTYTVSSIKENEIFITVAGKIKGFSGLTPDGTASGEYIINRADGKLISANYKNKIGSVVSLEISIWPKRKSA